MCDNVIGSHLTKIQGIFLSMTPVHYSQLYHSIVTQFENESQVTACVFWQVRPKVLKLPYTRKYTIQSHDLIHFASYIVTFEFRRWNYIRDQISILRYTAYNR